MLEARILTEVMVALCYVLEAIASVTIQAPFAKAYYGTPRKGKGCRQAKETTLSLSGDSPVRGERRTSSWRHLGFTTRRH